MQLTLFTDYGLRVLLMLAQKREAERVTIDTIAERFCMPRNHLVKVVQQLGRLGYIHTTRGKGGGLRLERPAAEIRVGDVVRRLENRLTVVDCSSPPCPLRDNCGLQQLLEEGVEAFLGVLDQRSIADLQRSPRQVRTLLRLARSP